MKRVRSGRSRTTCDRHRSPSFHMARRQESWLKNYEDVEFDVPGLVVGAPAEERPMLPPKSHPRPHIAGGSSSPPLPSYPTIARIPRSHSVPKSPLNPTTTTTTTTTVMPLRPPSRHFTRLASEEARAFGSPPPSASANPGLTSKGSMILYRVADPTTISSVNGTDTPLSHYSLRHLVASEDASSPLPLPESNNRVSIYSTSGDSIVSLNSDSKYPNIESQRSALIAYVYDPDADDDSLDDENDEVDWLHDPESIIAQKLSKLRSLPPPQRPPYSKPPTESSLSWRGFLNITMLILLIITVLALFIAYPTVATINDGGRNKLIAFNARINASGQADYTIDDGNTTTPGPT